MTEKFNLLFKPITSEEEMELFFQKVGWLVVLLLLVIGLLTIPLGAEGQPPTIPYVKKPKVVVDGVIGSDEYAAFFKDPKTNITVHWEHDGTNLYIGLVSPGTGWAAIGFGPRKTEMDGANMVIGYVATNGSLILVDEIGVGHRHYPDVQRGGKDSILSKAGTEMNGKTVIEFTLPLNSGDPLDHNFQPGQTYAFFLGYHKTAKNTLSLHSAFSDTWDLYIESTQGIETRPEETGSLWYYVLSLLAAGVLSAIIVHYVRRPKVIRFSQMKSRPIGKPLQDGVGNWPLAVR